MKLLDRTECRTQERQATTDWIPNNAVCLLPSPFALLSATQWVEIRKKCNFFPNSNQNCTSCTELTLIITAVTIICIGIFIPFNSFVYDWLLMYLPIANTNKNQLLHLHISHRRHYECRVFTQCLSWIDYYIRTFWWSLFILVINKQVLNWVAVQKNA